MDAASLFGSANSLYVSEEYEEALKHYTCAVTLQDCAEYRSCRAAAYIKLGKFTEASTDAEEALKFDPKSHMALHWKGIALFYMGDVARAKASFEESLHASLEAKAPRALWLRKCNAELSGSMLPLGGIANGVPKVAASPTSPAVGAAASAAGQPSSEKQVGKVPEPIDETKEGLSISGRKQIKREWYQTDTHVTVTIYAKEVQQSACKVGFKEAELSLSFPLPGAANEEYQMDTELYDAVEPSKCTLTVSKVKVELVLAKKNAGVQWKDLERAEEIVYTPDQPAYPTSNQQKRDWSQIDRDIDVELKNEKPAGDEALNKLFKEIYDRADDDTRRAMNKSFQTSGGTVLSTNWGEVATHDYEGKDRPTPPEGQEWRDWRGKK
mmetsp:Transcript_98482/g.228336  ORF Transcript_98482/g.228336 Transcript_98482/m.228336 type:complete len:382 (+) Transcript_98482:102-1247(+)|eukprot:CAMPEP_0171097678 /NCGR_PEP_ID=MMETSP0766_2-20121228/47682_1 /TAXON_ID=439317 /ORGANISM="Gambierdiscus australes, Strain CAWD 149" /LENGTH=381 /DNA_ID=CAMNT_0011556913 /DNA_START=74 /DNA_END=1219 /DNA_ORIENTATION=+